MLVSVCIVCVSVNEVTSISSREIYLTIHLVMRYIGTSGLRGSAATVDSMKMVHIMVPSFYQMLWVYQPHDICSIAETSN